MTENTADDRLDTAEDAAEMGALFETVQGGNRFTITYRDGDEETTTRIEATMTPKFTSDVGSDLTEGDIAFWFRDLDRSDDDPFGVVRYHPKLARIPPTVELYGYAATEGSGGRVDVLGEVVRAVRGDEGGD